MPIASPCHYNLLQQEQRFVALNMLIGYRQHHHHHEKSKSIIRKNENIKTSLINLRSTKTIPNTDHNTCNFMKQNKRSSNGSLPIISNSNIFVDDAVAGDVVSQLRKDKTIAPAAAQSAITSTDTANTTTNTNIPPPPLCIQTPQNQQQRRRPRVVSFGSVNIRWYEVILGDHPCCATGCPLSLGWNYYCNDDDDDDGCPSGMRLEDYENSRRDYRRQRSQTTRVKKTTCEERRNRLLQQVVQDQQQQQENRQEQQELQQKPQEHQYQQQQQQSQQQQQHETLTDNNNNASPVVELCSSSVMSVATMTDIRHACRRLQRHRDRRIQQAEVMTFFQQQQ